MEKWNKWDYVCSYCDANIEMTIKSTGHSHSEICPKCFQPMTLMSVVDATIYPTEKKEEQNMEYETALQFINVKSEMQNKISELETELEALRKNREYWLAENGRIGSQLIELVNMYYDDMADEDNLINSICEIIDYEPTKEIEFVANIQVTGRLKVNLNEYNQDTFDLESYLGFNVETDGVTEIDGIEVYDCEEC
jgi:hypothetical protein